MITKNFKLWQKAVMAKTSTSTETTTLPNPMIDVNGQSVDKVYMSNYSSTMLTFYNTNATTIDHTGAGTWLLVGSNGDVVTENDYTITPIETISSVVAQTTTRIIDSDGNFAMQVTRTLQNTAEETVTINELGLFRRVQWGSNSSSNVLFAREVLDTPLVVPAGASFTVSMIVKV